LTAIRMLKLVRALTIIIPLSTILALVGGGLLGTPVGRAVAISALGQCSFGQVRDGQHFQEQIGKVRMSMSDGSHQLREDGKYQLWSTPQGEFWYMGAMSNLDAFVLAEEQFDIYQTARIKPGAIVLDCGANYGTFTRRALNRGAAKVVAIEINSDIQEALRRTFANEIREGKVVVYGKGVWDRETELDLRGDSVVIDRKGPPVRLPVTTIDNIVSELQLPSVDFIKMDIEGAEKNALRGARATLLKFSPTMAISAEHLPDDAQAIPAQVKELAPGLRMEFGFCELSKPFRAAPNVIHFSK
jgi:FkbM family methyltransferase